LAPQFVTSTKLQRVDGSNVDVLMRGVTAQFWNVIADSVHVTNGDKPPAGVNAVIAGRSVATAQNGVHSGSSLPLRGIDWKVSGMFDANGAVWDSEIWTDFQALQSAFNAQGQVSSVWVQLVSPGDFDRFFSAFKQDRRLNSARAMRQHDYYTEQIGFIAAFVRIAAAGIACVLGLGAILAITNALGMALQMRRGEIATLRALGFRSNPLAIALLFEVLLVGAVSAVIAIFVGWMLLRGWSIDSSTGAYTISFQMDMHWRVMVWTLVYSLALGVLSAMWPIAQTIRAPLVNALKAE
jgi:putative ABC transport system permease protein